MKRLSLLAALQFVMLPVLAQQPMWLDPKVNSDNRMPRTADFFAYDTPDAAAKGEKEASALYMSLEGDWRFNFVRNVYDKPADFFKKDFDDSKWVKFPVPGLFEMNGYGDKIYTNVTYPWNNEHPVNPPYIGERENYVGSYRQDFRIPSDWKGKRIYMHVGSATSNLTLWINGQYVGYSEDSKIAAEFDITDYVQCGSSNLFAMQIMRWCDASYIEDQDFWRFTGIARQVYLYARPEAHVEDMRIVTDLDGKYVDATLEFSAALTGADGKTVSVSLQDAGREIASGKMTVADGRAEISIPVKNPSKWTAETPYLYNLVVTLSEADGKILEVIPQKVGFRKVEIRDRQLLVNGQPILVKGADRHEMSAKGGYIMTLDEMIEDIRIMKQMNINAVRTSHYPDDPRWYDLCDEYGIYLVAEANLEGHGMMYGPSPLARNADYELAHLERNQANVITFKNHPSIIVWSMGNEDGDGQNFVTCYKWIKEYDKTRPVQYEGATGSPDHCDIHCPMYADYGAMERHERGNDPRPMIECEYAHAMGNSEGGFKEYWDIIRANRSVQGGFIWDFVDQAVYGKNADGKDIFLYGGDEGRYPTSDQNFNCNGLIAPDRRWNPHAYEVQYFYQNIWVTPVDLRKGIFEVYNENFFKDLSEYSMEVVILWDGEEDSRFEVNLPKIGAQKRVKVTAPGISKRMKSLISSPCGTNLPEILIGVEFKLKNDAPLLEKGFVAARQQFMFRETEFCCTEATDYNPLNLPDVKIDEAVAYVKLDAAGVVYTFNKNSGWIDYIDIDGKQITQNGSQLKSDFWRAPTDNDYGANLHTRMQAWRNPNLRRTAFECKVEDGLGKVNVKYEIEQLYASLEIEYVLDREGYMHVSQKMITRPEEAAQAMAQAAPQRQGQRGQRPQSMPDLFKFGMTMNLAGEFDQVEYYGRGPIENYSDRNSSQFLGVYKSTVADQYYPYIRPQENGNKTDVRWWRVTNADGKGLEFRSDAPLSMSSLNYATADLDEGPQKHNVHAGDLTPRPYTVVHIDKVQYGLACVNSWGATPLEPYKLHYGDYSYSFVIKPVR